VRIRAAVAVVLFTCAASADIRRGKLHEEMRGDVVVQSDGGDTVLMAIDAAVDGRIDGRADTVFTIRAESSFNERFSFRLIDARVAVHENRVVVTSRHGSRVVAFGHDRRCTECGRAAAGVRQFAGFELRRLEHDKRWAPLPARSMPMEIRTPQREERPDRGRSQRKIGPADTQVEYEPMDEPWEPCGDVWYESEFCSGGGATHPRPPKECQAGGNPSISCSLTCNAVGGVSTSCSVSCPSGYYSCCFCETGDARCRCYRYQPRSP
jgi:hypothetical protein